MSEPDPRPEAVANAAGWLAANRLRHSTDALEAQLRGSGYSEAEIRAAWVEVYAGRAPATGMDLRGRAAAIVIVGFLGVFGLVWLRLATSSYTATFSVLEAMILGVVLLPVGLLSLVRIYNSDRLLRGVEGALVAALVVPFVLLVIVAGLCVATTGGFNG